MNLLEWSRGEAVRGSPEETVEVSTRILFISDFFVKIFLVCLFYLFVMGQNRRQ